MRLKNGQSTLEYCVLIIFLVAALISMKDFVKKGLNAKLRTSADEIGAQFDPDLFRRNITITEEGKSTGATMSMQRDLNGDGELTNDEWVVSTVFSIAETEPMVTNTTGQESIGVELN